MSRKAICLYKVEISFLPTHNETVVKSPELWPNRQNLNPFTWNRCL